MSYLDTLLIKYINTSYDIHTLSTYVFDDLVQHNPISFMTSQVFGNNTDYKYFGTWNDMENEYTLTTKLLVPCSYLISYYIQTHPPITQAATDSDEKFKVVLYSLIGSLTLLLVIVVIIEVVRCSKSYSYSYYMSSTPLVSSMNSHDV